MGNVFARNKKQAKQLFEDEAGKTSRIYVNKEGRPEWNPHTNYWRVERVQTPAAGTPGHVVQKGPVIRRYADGSIDANPLVGRNISAPTVRGDFGRMAPKFSQSTLKSPPPNFIAF